MFSFTCIAGLDAEAAAELEAIRGNLAKYKGKMGKEFEDIAINEMDWVRIMHSIIHILLNTHKPVPNWDQMIDGLKNSDSFKTASKSVLI